MAKNIEIGFWANTRGIPAYDRSSLGLLEASRYLDAEAPVKPDKELTVLGALATRAAGELVIYDKSKVVTDTLTKQHGLNGYSYAVPKLYVAQVMPERTYLEKLQADPDAIWAKEAYCALNGISMQRSENGSSPSDKVAIVERDTTLLPPVPEDTVRYQVVHIAR